MRIIQFSDTFLPIVDGVGTVVYQYALNLARKGHECYVVAPQTNTGYRGGWPFELIDYIAVPLPRMNSYSVGLPRLDRHCRKRLKQIAADVVHVHSPFVAGQAGVAWAKKLGVPVVGTFHSKYYDDFLQITGVELAAQAGVRYVVDFYEKCDEVWAVTESSADTLRGYGYQGPLRVMPNGADLPPPPSPEAVEAVSARFGLGDVPVLLFVGQMNWKKNIRCILDAMAQVNGAAAEFRLVLAGQGPHEAEIRKRAAELGLSGRTVCTGHIQDSETLNNLYARADLFLFPSIYDNGPLVIREAAAMGTPTVTIRGCSAAECIRDGENGLLCAGDPADLARVVSAALADRGRLRVIGERARETIPIPWSSLLDDVLERYRKLIRR